MSNEDIKHAVLSMDEDVLNVDKLYKLISLAPTPEEVTQCQEYDGPEEDLAVCERFFNQFRNMENVKERLQIWAYKMTFNEEYNANKVKVDLLIQIAKVIKTSEGFKITLATLLACGNFINGGTKKGGKHGFELETLQKIGAYKTTDSTMSILGYIFKFLRANYPDALEWIEEMSILPEVIRIETDNLDSEISAMDKDLDKVKELLKDNKDNDESKEEQEEDKFNDVMSAFYKESSTKIKDLQTDFSNTITEVQELAKFYGEKVKPSQFKLEEFFGIFNSFREEFIENKEKIEKQEAEEEKIRKKEEAQKRREEEMAKIKAERKAKKEAERAAKAEKRKKKKERKKKVGFATDPQDDDDGDSGGKKKKKKGKTDKMLDEMGDAGKYLAKLRKNRQINKSKGSLLGARKKSMFFKDRKHMMLDPEEINKLQNEAATNEDDEEL